VGRSVAPEIARRRLAFRFFLLQINRFHRQRNHFRRHQHLQLEDRTGWTSRTGVLRPRSWRGVRSAWLGTRSRVIHQRRENRRQCLFLLFTPARKTGHFLCVHSILVYIEEHYMGYFTGVHRFCAEGVRRLKTDGVKVIKHCITSIIILVL
jgi:hypothetical protein